MRYIALILVCCALYFIQAQLLPAIFHTNWLPNCILTAVVLVTIFKGRKMGLIAAAVIHFLHGTHGYANCILECHIRWYRP